MKLDNLTKKAIALAQKPSLFLFAGLGACSRRGKSRGLVSQLRCTRPEQPQDGWDLPEQAPAACSSPKNPQKPSSWWVTCGGKALVMPWHVASHPLDFGVNEGGSSCVPAKRNDCLVAFSSVK